MYSVNIKHAKKYVNWCLSKYIWIVLYSCATRTLPFPPLPYTRARDLPHVTPEPFVKSAASIEINALCRFIFIAFRYFGYLWTDSNLQAWHLWSVKWHSKYMYMNAWHQTLSRAGTRFLLSRFVWPLLWFLLYTLNLVWYI